MPVQEVDLPLWHHGEGGSHPTDFGFKFKAGDVWHDIQVKMETIQIAIFNGSEKYSFYHKVSVLILCN